MGGNEHVSERFRRLLALYRKPDGSKWGGQDLENGTGGEVTRSYVANLKGGRFENPGRAKHDNLVAMLEDETLRSILEETVRLRPRDRQLLLGIARQLSPHPEGGLGQVYPGG